MKLYFFNEVRTNNFTDPEVVAKIAGLEEVLGEYELDDRLPFYRVYYDYASDHLGDYTVGVATEYIETEKELELIRRGRFTIFPVDMKKTNPIAAMWKKIWELESQNRIHRAYRTDYEKYLPNGEVDIYISVLD